MNILALIGIAIGGAIGALSRGLLTRMLKRHLPEQFPFATLIVNLIACFAALGLLVMPLALNEVLYLTLTVGFLGGFSTLATMNFEAVSLFATKRYKYCFAYLAITYASTLGAAALGFALVSFFVG